MRIIVEILKKFIVVFSIALIAFSVLLTKGCGGSGDTAQQNWKISALTPSLAAPSSFFAYTCYPTVQFLVTNPQGNAVQGIVLAISSGPSEAWVAPAVLPPDNTCAAALAGGHSSATMSTDDNGVVSLEFVVEPTVADLGVIYFIDVSSGAATPVEVLTAATVTTP